MFIAKIKMTTLNSSSLPSEKKHVLADRIKDQLITLILSSPLNISVIPDDLERQIYESIFSTIEDVLIEPSTWQKIKANLCCCLSSSDIEQPGKEEEEHRSSVIEQEMAIFQIE